MAKYCSKQCQSVGSVCDFCRYYNFNGDSDGTYNGRGYCVNLEKHKDPCDGEGCKLFICKDYKLKAPRK